MRVLDACATAGAHAVRILKITRDQSSRLAACAPALMRLAACGVCKSSEDAWGDMQECGHAWQRLHDLARLSGDVACHAPQWHPSLALCATGRAPHRLYSSFLYCKAEPRRRRRAYRTGAICNIILYLFYKFLFTQVLLVVRGCER
jgi:hypothetical protein